MRYILSIVITLLCLATSSQAMHFGEFEYFSDVQELTEDYHARTDEGTRGRFHTNGELYVSQFACCPIFYGFFTQVEDYVVGLSPSQYEGVFTGGFQFGYDRVEWPPTTAIEIIKDAASPEYTFSAHTPDSLSLTTCIQFHGSQFSVAQFAQAQVQGQDTLYTLGWTIEDLPTDPGVIWIQGVTRIQGVVAGQVTLLSSDSLFIMGDLIVADADTVSFADVDSFGMVPNGSPNRIGLIGEKDVIIAATLSNGFANGSHQPYEFCEMETWDPVIELNLQVRRDVVITAAILALGCSFEAEFWKTTALQATPPDSIEMNSFCPHWNNTEVTLFDCSDVSDHIDDRGHIWFCGSLCQSLVGMKLRNPPGPWGYGRIGYEAKHYRYDENLISNPPPLWPEVEWVDDTPPTITPSPSAADLCGTVEDLDAFRFHWYAGLISIQIEDHELPDDGDVYRCVTIMDGDTLETTYFGVGGLYTPNVELPLTGNHQLHIEISWNAQVWNQYGDLCTWELGFTDVDEPPFATDPGSISLAAFPNPFNPQTQVSIYLPWADHAKVEVFDLLGQKVRTLNDASLGAGSHQFALSASGLSSGLYFVRLEACGQVELKKIISVQ